jgi:hypothetical protein
MPEEIKIEKRSHKRIQIRNDAFAIIKPRSDRLLVSIENLSEGGVAFRYISDSTWSVDTLDIMLIDDNFFLEKLDVKAVSDFELTDTSLVRNIKMRMQCLKFVSLSSFQQERLKEFIRLYEAPAYSGPERRSNIERRSGIDRRRDTSFYRF